MSAGGSRPRRILVALNASERSRALLEPAARLTRGLQAELVGLFLEDENLLRLASLPFAQVVGQTTCPQRIDRSSIERLLHRGRSDAQRALEAVRHRYELPGELRVVRSDPRLALSTVADPGDLLVLERSEFGTALSETLARSDVSVLCLSGAIVHLRSVTLLFEPGESGVQHLEIAAQLAAATGGDLTVVVGAGEIGPIEPAVRAVAMRNGVRFQLRLSRSSRDARETTTADALLVTTWRSLEEKPGKLRLRLGAASRSILILR